MKISIREEENKIMVQDDKNNVIETYEKDKPINFKGLLDYLVDLKFSVKVALIVGESDDIQNQALYNLIKQICLEYNNNYESFEKFKQSRK